MLWYFYRRQRADGVGTTATRRKGNTCRLVCRHRPLPPSLRAQPHQPPRRGSGSVSTPPRMSYTQRYTYHMAMVYHATTKYSAAKANKIVVQSHSVERQITGWPAWLRFRKPSRTKYLRKPGM